MNKKVLAVVIAATLMLSACSLDEVTTPENTFAETTTETTVNGPIRDGEYIINFGHYERHGISKPVEWKILKEEDGKLLIISTAILYYLPYEEKHNDVTWETCSLRTWLNEDFIDKTFNTTEQEYILTVTNSNPDNAEYGTKGGKDTEDKVFLLSANEAETLFADNAARNSSDDWWLRSPGRAPGTAASVGDSGWATSGGYIYDGLLTSSVIGVRPALWIKLES